MAELTLTQVSKTYDKKVLAVDSCDLKVHHGEMMVLLGPSGCGKSTTLRLIAGLEKLDAGEIHIDQELVNHIEPNDRDIAMVFQNYALYPHMSVYDNMAFGLKMRKWPKQKIESKVKEVANKLGLQDLLKRKPKALSGGQRQRVALGRAIVRDPKLYLFDEPLSNLDAILRIEMRKEISKLHRENKVTSIFVTHDQSEAMTLGDRICIMDQGHIQQIGTPKEIYDRPANQFVAKFIGTPPMNLFEGQTEGTTFQNSHLKVPIPSHLKSSETITTLGIRPEHIKLAQPQADHIQVEPTFLHCENLGAEALVYLKLGQTEFVVRVFDSNISELQNLTKVFLPLDKCAFFNSAGNSLF